MRPFPVLLLSVSVLSACSEWENDIYKVRNQGLSDDMESPITTADGQLYNMSFDSWSRDGSNESCYASDASDAEKRVWASPNSTTAFLGKATCVPERSFVAFAGPGKAAVKLQTQMVNALISKKLASGCLFTGQMGNISISRMNASLKWGVPFTLRPKAMEGYACYRPAAISNAQPPYENRLGETDNGHVFVILCDWTEQFTVDPALSSFVDTENDPAIIGYAKVTFDHTMSGYEKFSANIEYRNGRTPKYLVIVASSSALGDFFTGGDGSTLYLDEFRFTY
ncbi:MAG: PCMD domain-containing protein [Bacteroidaceae bacterium]|nr:PCMD domain-containing protein [Bacteroidaceae bacterium]